MENISHDELNILEDPLLIDVRSPAEFSEDHLPGAINLPVLDNDQRDDVGTIYNQESQFKARQKGARKISGNLPEILKQIEHKADQNRPVVVYCWRGGLRSESLSVVLDRIGYPTYRISGGYKAYRQHVHQFFDEKNWDNNLITIFGLTGSGKTELLKLMENQGHSIIDLEHAANHRGSAFGSIGLGSQPSQKAFENRLFQQLDDANSPVFLEGESRHIGALKIPSTLFEQLIEPPRIWLETSIENRVDNIYQEYHWPEARDELINKLDNLIERLGHATVESLKDTLKDGDVRTVINTLLDEYYDPAYEHSCPSIDEFDLSINGDDLEKSAKDIGDWTNKKITGLT